MVLPTINLPEISELDRENAFVINFTAACKTLLDEWEASASQEIPLIAKVLYAWRPPLLEEVFTATMLKGRDEAESEFASFIKLASDELGPNREDNGRFAAMVKLVKAQMILNQNTCEHS